MHSPWLRAAFRSLAVCALATTSIAHAQSTRTNLGTLTCTVADSDLPSTRPENQERGVRCSFRGAGAGPEQTYSGTITRLGDDRLPNSSTVQIWAVHGPADSEAVPGFLAQSYVGRPLSSGDQSTLALTGQSDSDIVLQASTPIGRPGSDGVTLLDLKLVSIPT